MGRDLYWGEMTPAQARRAAVWDFICMLPHDCFHVGVALIGLAAAGLCLLGAYECYIQAIIYSVGCVENCKPTDWPSEWAIYGLGTIAIGGAFVCLGFAVWMLRRLFQRETLD